MFSASPARQIAFINTPIDFLLIGGLSIIHCAVFKWMDGLTPQMIYYTGASAATVAWIINNPHFSATSYRLYSSRDNIRQFPVTALAVPVLLLVIVCAALYSPAAIAPWLVKIFMLWSPYHFSAQSLGISLLYARRAGFIVDPLSRRFLSCFIFMTFIAPSLLAETGGNRSYYNIIVPSFGLPPWMWDISVAAMYTFGAIAIVFLVRAAWRQKIRLPLLLLVPPVTQFFWFKIGASVQGFTELIPAYHALQYLVIAWALQLKEKLDAGNLTPSPRFAIRESLRWAAINIAGGVGLFQALPWLMHKITRADLFMATGIVIVAVQMHHFFVDGVIWKLRNPKVSQPLMTNVYELIRSPA